MSTLSNLKTKKKTLNTAKKSLQNKEDYTSRVAKAGQEVEAALNNCLHREGEISNYIKPVLEFDVDYHSDLTESIVYLNIAIGKNDEKIREEQERIRIEAEKARAEKEAREQAEAENKT